jgi:tetratricopeptide (TPR) repeat protein
MKGHPPEFGELTRLVDDPFDPAGQLLRSEADHYAEGLDERAAWRRLEARRARIRARNTVAMVTGVAAAIAALVLVRTRLEPHEPELALSSEVVRANAGEPKRPAVTVKPEPVEPDRSRPGPLPRWHALAPSSAESRGVRDCRELGQAGDARRAVECYQSQTTGAGIAAEVALHEVARLRAESLNDPHGALQALGEHRKRFPEGALRGEVELATVRVLARLGRNEEALRESEALLEKPWGRENANELHLVRGRIYADRLQDFAHAATEFMALVGDPSPAGDEAEFRRAECLQRLGRTGDARAAYRAYLERGQRLREVDAKARLAALSEVP